MEIIPLPSDVMLFLFLVAVVAGCIDTLAGGGGLLTLPALIMCGIPPLFALGTNKLQGSMGTAMASLMMLRKRRVNWPDVKILMLAAFVGSTCGTIVVQFVDTRVLAFVVPTVLVLTAVYFILVRQVEEGNGRERITEKRYTGFVVPLIGWYDGMFGPGTGSFFALAGVSLRGLGLIQSTAVAKTLNFSTNISSLFVFLLAGKLFWSAGLLMMAGQALGAWAGANLLYRIKPMYLRYLVVTMCLAMLVRYLLTM